MKTTLRFPLRNMCVICMLIFFSLTQSIAAQGSWTTSQSDDETFMAFVNQSRLVSLFSEAQRRLASAEDSHSQNANTANAKVVLLPANLHFLYIQSLLFPKTLEALEENDISNRIYVVYNSRRGRQLGWGYAQAPVVTCEVETSIYIYHDLNGKISLVTHTTNSAGAKGKSVLGVVTESIVFPAAASVEEKDLGPVIASVLAYSDGHDAQRFMDPDKRARALYHTLADGHRYFSAFGTEKHRAAENLGLIGTPLAGELLIKAYQRIRLIESTDIALGTKIIDSLSHCKNNDVTAFLIRQLYHPQTQIPSIARAIGDRCQLDYGYYAQDAIRAASAIALGEIADKSALPHLEKFIENIWAAEPAERLGYVPSSKEAQIRFNFGLYAGKHGRAQGYSVKDKTDAYYQKCREDILSAGDDAVNVLFDIAQNNPGSSSYPLNLIIVIELLGDMDSPKVTRFLVDALKHPHGTVNDKAALALVTLLGNKAAVNLVVGLLDDKDSYVQWAAERALSKITGEKFGRDKSKWIQWIEEREKHEKQGVSP